MWCSIPSYRERSAAKEAIALLKPYLPAMLFLDTSAPAAADALDEKEYEGAVPAAGEKEEEEVKEGVDDAGEQAQRRPLVPVKVCAQGLLYASMGWLM